LFVSCLADAEFSRAGGVDSRLLTRVLRFLQTIGKQANLSQQREYFFVPLQSAKV